jgi:hypothetical protein
VVTIGWYAAVIHENGTLYRHGKGKVCVGVQKNHSATKIQWWFRTNYGTEHPQENPFTSGKSDLLKLVAFVLRIIRADDRHDCGTCSCHFAVVCRNPQGGQVGNWAMSLT